MRNNVIDDTQIIGMQKIGQVATINHNNRHYHELSIP